MFKGLRCRHTQSISRLNGLFKAAKPFPHLFVEGVFKDSLLTQAKDELLAGEWFRKRVDLYDFLQTDHLRRQASSASAVATIQDALYGDEFRSWLEVRTPEQLRLSESLVCWGSLRGSSFTDAC